MEGQRRCFVVCSLVVHEQQLLGMQDWLLLVVRRQPSAPVVTSRCLVRHAPARLPVFPTGYSITHCENDDTNPLLDLRLRNDEREKKTENTYADIDDCPS